MEKFTDLRSGGRALARGLADYAGRGDVVVLGVVRAGTPVAAEVSERLGAPLDVIILRRLFASRARAGQPVCAASVAGTLVLDEEMPPRAGAPESPLDYFIADALDGLARRERACRAALPPRDLAGKTVLLVDCGVHTGSTMLAAVRALRATKPARVVAAFPVASAEGLAAVRAAADEVVCLASAEIFGHAGLWYEDFTRPGDEGTPALLGEAACSRGE